MSFDELVRSIRDVHNTMVARAGKAVNVNLTIRNWAIGFYIQEYEQNGTDRAKYGENIIGSLSVRLKKTGIRGMGDRDLRIYRQFYITYPEIRESLTPEFRSLITSKNVQLPKIRGSVTAKFVQLDRQQLITRISFTHFVELISIDDPIKRTFYEVECIRGGWSVRELRRQINSLYYERSGLSLNREKLSKIIQESAEGDDPELAIRDPYVFEFLGLKPSETMGESELEDRLLDSVKEFLLEMGTGFCFEARQKRILIGETHGFIDLVFYHRILKCHVLVELKLSGFTHEAIGQLNTYVSWYTKNMMTKGDNPPVGLLLCTKKDNTLVEYAFSGMNNRLFVSKYMLELPKPEDIQRFLESKIRDMEEG